MRHKLSVSEINSHCKQSDSLGVTFKRTFSVSVLSLFGEHGSEIANSNREAGVTVNKTE